MNSLRALSSFAIGLCLTLTTYAFGQMDTSSKQVLADVSGEKLTAADLDQMEGGKLLQARYQYYVNERKALNQLIDEKLLEIQARSKGITVDQLLEREVYNQVKDPTEDQLEVYYEGLDSDQPYSAVRDQILDHIRELRKGKAKAAYVQKLRSSATLHVLLQPPTADVSIENAYIRGPKDAPVVLVEFADYECPYCIKINPQLQQLQKEYGNRLAVVYKDFPLPMHHQAEKAAEAGRCAGEQGKFWEMHDVLFYSKQLEIDELKEHARVLQLDGDRFDKCLDDGAETAAVKKDKDEGTKLGLNGTPSFFVNGHFISGAQDYNALREVIDEQLAIVSSTSSHSEMSKK